MNVSEYYPYLVLIVIGVTFLLIYRNVLQAGVGLLLAVIVFVLFGILTSEEVLAGFANDKIASILLLILLTAGIRKNFRIEAVFDKVFKKAGTYRKFLFQMMAQSAVISSVINNAPVVALLTPYVVDWGKKTGISPSKLLIPLSFATISGGMITVIGTSTTLLLNGFLTSMDEPNLVNGNLIIPGLVVVVITILFFVTIGNKLLPDHKDLIERFQSKRSDFLVQAELPESSDFIGKSIAEAGLRKIESGYIVEIVRGDEVIYPVNPEEKILKGDALIFAGDKTSIIKYIDDHEHLIFPSDITDPSDEGRDVIECVINARSSLIGKKIKDSDFRSRYDAAIVAVQRDGQRLVGKIGDTKLMAGDLLLVFAGSSFEERVDLYRDLVVISSQKTNKISTKRRNAALLTIIGAIIFLLTYGALGLFTSLLIIFSIMIAYGLISLTDIKRELDLNLVAILVFSLALGTAMIKTGAGEMIANGMIDLLSPFGNIALLTGIMLIASLLTAIIGNVGSVSICFPMAYGLATSLGVPGTPFYLALAFGASAAFATPISYQTNLIIFGPGGYTFKDFFRVGLPMTLLYLAGAITTILLIYGKDL